MFAVYAESFSSDDPLQGLVVGEQPDPEPPAGWTTVTVKAASLNHHDLWSLRGVGLKQEALPMTLGCDAAGLRRGRQRGRRARRDQRPLLAWRRDPRPATLPAQRALPRHLRGQGDGADLQRRAEAGVDELRGGRVPAHRVAHRVPDALHPGWAEARRERARPGRRRRCGDRADHAGPSRRAAGLGDQPRRDQACPRAGARRPRGLRVRRPASRARRRSHGDRRQGDLVPLGQVAQARAARSSSAAPPAAPTSTTPA